LACVAFDLIASDHRRPFGYATSDTYYYLTVARHAVHERRLAFDGIHSTNGFHPVWQLVLVPVTALVEGLGGQGHHLLYVVIALCALMISGALYLLGLALTRDGQVSPLYGLTVFGLYGVLAAFAWVTAFGYKHTSNDALPSLAGSTFSYANGMESGALLLSFAWVAWLYVKRDVLGARRDAAWFGFALALMTLCRVDHVFITVPIVALLALQGWRARRWRNLFVAGLMFAAPLCVWALSNRIWFEHWVPVSGAMKSNFPEVNHANLDRVWACIRHFRAQTYWRHFRVDQQVAPMVVAVIYLVGAAIARPTWKMAQLLIPVAAGILVLGAYDILYVDLTLHGSWYAPVSTLFVSLAFVVGLSGIRLPSWTLILTLSASVYGFVEFQRYVTVNQGYSHFYYDIAPKVVAFYDGHPPHLLENDDGIITFSTKFPAMAGMGLALDPEGANAWHHGQIVPLAIARGYDRLASAMYWADAGSLHKDMTQEALRAFVQRHLSIPNPETLHFTVEYQDGGFGIIAMSK